jgi:hypothetical protein
MRQSLEPLIDAWREYVDRAGAVNGHDVEELETHLRDQITDLGEAGLSDEEAFLIAVKRIGDIDTLSREFAREHSGRLWRQLAVPGEAEPSGSTTGLVEALVAAVLAAIAVHIPRLIDPRITDPEYLQTASLIVFLSLAWYFARRQRLSIVQIVLTTIPFVVGALVVGLYPWQPSSQTELLAAYHLPVVLWFVVAYPYTSGAWRSHERRMDFVRFTGEWVIYYVLIGLGGGVLLALTSVILEPAGPEVVENVMLWAAPSGAAGAVIVAAWLVEAKKSVVENMAPVLTMIFTPLFAVMLTGAAIAYAVFGLGAEFDREMIGVFDILLVVVLGLLLYRISARDSTQPPGWMDRVQLVAVIAALALELMVMVDMTVRIGELGITPNRAAVLGLNALLLVNLAWAAWLLARFLAGRAGIHRLERWQTAYLPVFALWTAAVVLVFPLLFDFA